MPVARAAEEVLVSMEQLRASLMNVASHLAPLTQHLHLLEKKLSVLETKSMGTSLSSNDVTVLMAAAIATLNETLAQPVKPIYDDKGILVGARRVRDLQ